MTDSHYDTHPLRAYVVDRLDLKYVPDAIWHKQITRQFVELCDRAPSPVERRELQERLVDLVREDVKGAAALGVDTTPWTTPREKRSAAAEANLSPNDPIALRAQALCSYWAKLAEAESRVRRFRKNVLGGAVLSESEARDFINSPHAIRLHRLADELCHHYPWEHQDAAWFILTGEAPWVPPLTAHMKRMYPPISHGAITITAAHWVPNAEVGKFYAELKAQHVDAAPTPSPRRLALFQFVIERSQGKNEWEPLKQWGTRDEQVKQVLVRGLDIPPWRSLQAQWNEQYPPNHEWHYNDHRNLRRDFKDAFEALVGY